MFYCFLDTNIFIQYMMYDDVDWLKVLHVPAVCLLIPPTVLKQLDKFKDDPISDRRRKRARSILSKLANEDTTKDISVRHNTLLRLLFKPVEAEFLRLNDLSPDDTDDQIIGSVLKFKEDNPVADVALFAGDYGIRFKARIHNIREIEPPEDLRLPEEADPSQKKIRELEQEVAKLKYSKPDLTIGFRQREDIHKTINFAIDFNPQGISLEKIQELLVAMRDTLIYDGSVWQSSEYLQLNSLLEAWNPSRAPNREETAAYETEVAEYLKSYEGYLKQLSIFKAVASHIRPVYAILKSVGYAPAKDIDIRLHFPNGMNVSSEPILCPKAPAIPTRPEPKPIYGYGLDRYMESFGLFPRDNYLDILSDIVSGPPPPPRTSGLKIRKTNSYEVTYDLDYLKQHDTWELDPIYVVFETPGTLPTAIPVEYKIVAANIPDPIEGELLIHIDQK